MNKIYDNYILYYSKYERTFMFKPDIINKICINDVIKENNYIFCNMIITYPCDAGMKFMGA